MEVAIKETSVIGLSNIKTKYIHDHLPWIEYPVGLHLSYNTPIIDRMIDNFIAIGEFRNRPINLICRGNSGSIIAAFFASRLYNFASKIFISYVRKDSEDRHNDAFFISDDHVIVIVDDFLSTGETMRQIYNRIQPYLYKQDDRQVDCICVSGEYSYHTHKIGFEPKYFICESSSK